MNNNEMVSVRRELLERICAMNWSGVGRAECRRELRDLLAMSATQSRSEPVRLPERKVIDENGNGREWSMFDKGFNCCLDGVGALGPLYTHPAAQPVPPAGGEPEIHKPWGSVGTEFVLLSDHRAHVTRLQTEVETLHTALRTEVEAGDSWKREAQDLREELDALKAQPQGEPVAHVYTMEALVPGGSVRHHAELYRSLPSGTKLYASPPTPVAVVLPEREAMRDIIAAAIGGDTYDCTRVWSAWGVGTMSEDDFISLVDQEDRLYEIADVFLDEVRRLNP